MEEEFFSTIKLTSGEEIIAKVSYLPDEDSILLDKPMLVEKITQKRNGKSTEAFVLKDWINSTYDTMFVVRMEQVVTMSELDKRIEKFYLSNTDLEYKNSTSINVSPDQFSKRMGYLGSIKETKKLLEEIYKKS
jgi:hypothetical protein